MKMKPVLTGTKLFRQVKRLYFDAFPEPERLGLTRMMLLSMVRPSVSCLAFVEGESLLGFAFTVKTDSLLYISYIAVAPELRSRGLGAEILRALENRWPLPQICEAKIPHPGQPDFAQDQRRLRFWEKNGFDFYDHAHKITNPRGIDYYICGKGTEFSREAYFRLFDQLSLRPRRKG